MSRACAPWDARAERQWNGRIGQISAGCAVTVVGLQKAEQHNGRQGEVVAYVPEKDRFRVKLQHQGGGDASHRRRQKPEWLNVRAANLDPGRYTVRVEGVQIPPSLAPTIESLTWSHTHAVRRRGRRAHRTAEKGWPLKARMEEEQRPALLEVALLLIREVLALTKYRVMGWLG